MTLSALRLSDEKLDEKLSQIVDDAVAKFGGRLDAILAAPRLHAAEAGWRVRPLEWTSTTDGDLSRAECILGTYRVWTHYDAAGLWFWELTCGALRKDTGTAVNEAEAKAFVEAHYAASISSAILPGGEGKSNSPEIPDGWQLVPARELERFRVAVWEFFSDWKKGDFSLSTLAALDAQSMDEAAERFNIAMLSAAPSHHTVGEE